jgi:CRP/FNR family cyclic AMP-dependent transcriptional regulator
MLNFDKNIYSDLTYLGCAESYLEDIVENVDQITLFQDFSLDEIKAVCHYLHCYAAPRGYILFEEGEIANHLIIVLSGDVVVNQLNNKSVINKLGADESVDYGLGATLGEFSMVDNQPWNATCLTKVPTDFAVLNRQSLNEILAYYPRLGNKLLLVLMQMMAFRLRNVAVHSGAQIVNRIV